MSSPVGVMLASCLTPLIVQDDPENIPIQNWVYSIPSTVTMLMFILFVRSSNPPTPPSKSAAENTSKLQKTTIPHYNSSLGPRVAGGEGKSLPS